MKYLADRPRRATIAALATAAGAAGLAVLRISGAEAFSVVRRLCPGLPEVPAPRHMYLRDIVDPLSGRRVDQGLVVVFPGPRSFTGEDVAEIHGHGGAAQSRVLLQAALAAGARGALPGEFSRRAVESGRMGLPEAEGLAELVSAGSDAALAAARALMDGALTQRVEKLLEEVEALLAEWEGCLDFPDDVDAVAEEGWPGRLTGLATGLERLASSWARGRRLRDGARVVLLGPPNAGKSSLLNALVGWERAIVDAEAGTTRDSVEARVGLDGVEVTLVDGAGVREPSNRAEALGVERVRRAVADADLVLAVFDGSRTPGPETRAAVELARDTGRPVRAVLNKSDLGHAGHAELGAALGDVARLTVSARTGVGLEALRGELAAALGTGPVGEQEVVVTLERHHRSLAAALEGVREARARVEGGVGLDAAGEELRAARSALASVVGKGALPDDLLDRVFDRFCIGK